MKFSDLIKRLELYLKDNHSRVSNDLNLAVEELHQKHSEYKRIKKMAFKRQVEKAYEILSQNSNIVNLSENKTPNSPVEDEFDANIYGEAIDEKTSEAYVKDDPNNAINNMIIDIYKKNRISKEQKLVIQNLSENKSEIKRVNINDFIQENSKKKTKLNESITNQNKKTNFNSDNIQNSNQFEHKKFLKKNILSSKQNKDLIKSSINFDAFACDQELKNSIFRRIYYILSPEQFLNNGKIPPRGFLLHGPPGCGKTQLVYAIAGELDLPLLKVTSTELISGVSGESEENIRAVFDKAILNAPCILFIDEIEAISQRRETASKNMEHRIVTQLLSCFDDLALKAYVPIVVIGATNQVDSLDIGLRRAGRFDQEIAIGIPDDKQRKKILEILCCKIKKHPNIDIDKIVLNTPGYVGADLNSLIDEALISALDRLLDEKFKLENTNDKIDEEQGINLINWIKNKLIKIQLVTETENDVDSNCTQTVEINQNDFEIAIKRVQPSSKREGFATVPDVSWDDIGALQNVREELKIAILAPVKYSRQCEIFNFIKPPGILMVGPPGCGKTLLAKAIAKESGINFISVKGPELLNMYVGESEKAVRSLFQRARNSKPCVIFFDEIDAICVKRSDSSADNGATTRVVNQMLTEMDGLDSRKGVFLMAASNRPDIIDPAILRPGRLDKIIYVGLPNFEDRLEILKTITKNGTKPRLDSDVNFEEIAKDLRCQTFTGADLSALVREASEFALKEFIKNPLPENEIVRLRHFELAFNKIKPSVSQKDSEKYQRMKSICVNLQ